MALKAVYKDHITYFDVFFRRVPDGGGFAIAAGLEQLIDYIENLHFSPEDIAYLRAGTFSARNFCPIWRTSISPATSTPCRREPRCSPRAHGHRPGQGHRGPAHRDLHAADHQPPEPDRHQGQPYRPVPPVAARCWSSPPPGTGADAAIIGARAAYIGGVAGTACTISDQIYGVPAGGTMAHAWVQMFDSEYDAFKTYCQIYPHNATLLVDTYNTLKSGVPNAIRPLTRCLSPWASPSAASDWIPATWPI